MARRVVVERAGLGAEIVVRQNLQLEASRPEARGKRAMLAALGDEEGQTKLRLAPRMMRTRSRDSTKKSLSWVVRKMRKMMPAHLTGFRVGC